MGSLNIENALFIIPDLKIIIPFILISISTIGKIFHVKWSLEERGIAKRTSYFESATILYLCIKDFMYRQRVDGTSSFRVGGEACEDAKIPLKEVNPRRRWSTIGNLGEKSEKSGKVKS